MHMLAEPDCEIDATAVSACEVSAAVGGFEIIDPLADEWRELCALAVHDEPFYRPEWIRAHIRIFTPGARLRLITARIDGRLCLVLPVLEERGRFNKVPLRKLRAPTNCHGGRVDAVRIKGSEGLAALQATWEYLKRLDGWDLLHLGNTPENSTLSRMAELAVQDNFPTLRLPDRPNPYIPIPSSTDLLDQLPPNGKLRSQLRQARRRLMRMGTLKLSRVETADRNSLHRFYDVEASGWKGRAGTSILGNGSLPFYDEIAQSAARFGYFSLYLLECGDDLLSGHFAFNYRDRCYSPIVTYNEKYRQYAPGHLIVSEILYDCSVRGIRGFDITGQDQPWKMKWTTEVRNVNHHFVFNGRLGRLAHALGCQLRPALGRLLKWKTDAV